jgi:ABC-type transport system involved in multi-copper enzyme maturation permease subunit
MSAPDGAGGGTDAGAGADAGAGRLSGSGGRWTRLVALAQREFTTVLRTRSFAALALAVAAAIVGVPVLSGTGGYLPLVLDLLTVVEVLVAVLAVAFGVWTVLADAERGELAVIRTFPVGRGTYAVGTYLGRATALLVAVLVPLAVAGVVVPLFREPTTSVIASHATVDSPTYYLRFVALAAGYALVVLALAVAVSALARTRRRGVALGTLAVLIVVVGFDFLVVAGVSLGVLDGSLPLVLGLTPPGAFRGLVLATAAGGLVETGPPAAAPLVSLVGLALWLVVGLGTATLAAWSSEGA